MRAPPSRRAQTVPHGRSAATGVLTLFLGQFDRARIQTNEHVVVLDAASFKTGKGPIPPHCMAQNAPMFVSDVLADAVSVPTLKGAFGKVCQRERERESRERARERAYREEERESAERYIYIERKGW